MQNQSSSSINFSLISDTISRGKVQRTFMTRTYQLAFDQKGVITYILQAKDDATKIHHENNNPVFARNMLENLGFDGNLHKMCCVHSFKLYPYLR